MTEGDEGQGSMHHRLISPKSSPSELMSLGASGACGVVQVTPAKWVELGFGDEVVPSVTYIDCFIYRLSDPEAAGGFRWVSSRSARLHGPWHRSGATVGTTPPLHGFTAFGTEVGAL